MNKKIGETILLFFLMILPTLAMTCEIEFDILGTKKESYQKGDIIIIHVKVKYTHRRCPVAIESTKYSHKGLEILGATKWEETSFNTFERKFKIKVIDNSKDNLEFNALRTCSKEGGAGSIKFKINKTDL